jgi:mRNA interferase MazF
MPYDFGDVVLVSFPFTSQTTSKRRPAVVVSRRSYNTARPDVVAMAITSQVRLAQDHSDAVIREWEAASLLKPSVVKPSSPRSSKRWSCVGLEDCPRRIRLPFCG